MSSGEPYATMPLGGLLEHLYYLSLLFEADPIMKIESERVLRGALVT
jgi:hypothetical protein